MIGTRWTVLAALSAACLAPQLAAQQWRAGTDIGVVTRAVQARTSRDADSALAGWQARARGLLRFAAVIDHGNGPIERVIKADELEVELYGEAPSRSKQVIVAWRDTTFQPTTIRYHRDHLGIVANDFGMMIRLGEGDEVRDVPHPLSPAGLEWYRFRLGDTVEIRSSSGVIRVASVAVRPRDPDLAGVVGTMLLDLDRAMLVRLQFSFTPASYRDPTVSAITVRLESALHGQSHWLPWRQSIAIHRASPLIALPLSTVIRADWTIDDYQLEVTHPPGRFGGGLIDGLRVPGGDALWQSSWRELLAQAPATDAEMDAVVSRATSLLAAGGLDGLPALRLLAAEGLSSLIRINRVQGVTLGVGVRLELPARSRLDLGGALGTADGRFTGRASVSRATAGLRVGVSGSSAVVDVHAWPRRSGIRNSLATLHRGDDAGDWIRLTRFEAFVEPGETGIRRLTLGRERVRPAQAHFTALSGVRDPNPAFAARDNWVVGAMLGQRRSGDGGVWQLDLEAGAGGPEWFRAAVTVQDKPGPVTWRLDAGWGSADLPADRGFVLGGAGSLVGTVPRSLAGRRAIRAEVAWPIPVDIGTPLWPTPLASRMSPFLAAGWAGGRLNDSPWSGRGGVQPVIGIRLDLWGPLVRFEAGWAPRSRSLGLSVDAHPDWWPLL